jgi:sugar lactone lactonase YvrE
MDILKIAIAGAAALAASGCQNEPKTKMMEKYTEIKHQLGEGPWWDSDKQELAWIDIDGQSLCYAEPASQPSCHQLPFRPGTVVPTDKGNFLLAIGNAAAIFSREEQKITDTIAQLPFDTSKLRFNDGKCAPNGTFWVGTVETETYSKPLAALYRLKDTVFEEMLQGITISNGICWSPGGETMYYIDSPTRTVKAFDYNLRTSDISNPRIVINTPPDWGTPDGSCTDANGNIWIAQWGGSCAALWNPATGEMIKKIEVPAKNVTAVALGGPNGRSLYITTAAVAMEPDDEARFPDAGTTYVIEVETPGIGTQKWAEK